VGGGLCSSNRGNEDGIVRNTLKNKEECVHFGRLLCCWHLGEISENLNWFISLLLGEEAYLENIFRYMSHRISKS
jgi:hypothetical protein